MAFEPVEETNDRIPFFDFNDGDVLTGHYLGVEKFMVKGDPRSKYVIQLDDGTKQGISGVKIIKDSFSQIAPGTLVEVTYLGEATGKNGREYKKFKVQQDKTNVIATNGSLGGAPRASIADAAASFKAPQQIA